MHASCNREVAAHVDDVCDEALLQLSAESRVEWALENLPANHVLTSSFGAQSAVMLHMLSRRKADIPIVLIDTGYLFPETYLFIDELARRLALNLNVYRSPMSSAWQEARYGRRWEQGVEALAAYNRDNKVEPMERALNELSVGTWFAGLRRSQSPSRAATPFVDSSAGRFKVCPIADWSDRDVYAYLKKYDLPYHPLWERGFVSVGDVHTTRTLAEAGSLEGTRFFGMRRECGLHEMDFGRGS